NSFHMVVARVDDGQLKIIDRLREPTRLAAGLDARRRLSDASIKRATATLARFGQRLRHLDPHNVRVVGTNTLRSARNAEQFRLIAESALGHRIDVISGVEEARLIYLGVSHAMAPDRDRRLVIDIGGGSTEFIIGTGFDALQMDSLYMGCVSWTARFFGDGKISKTRMEQAELAARQELETIESRFQPDHWDCALGASGTMKAVRSLVIGMGWCERGITRAALQKLRRWLIQQGNIERLQFKDLKDDRRISLPGGVAVLSASMQALGIESMRVSQMALREGVLYDLLGRIRHEDIRESTVRSLAERYGIDEAQASRVEQTALRCFSQLAEFLPLDAELCEPLLRWAARLHEIGIAVSHAQYHKHGGYLLRYGDLPGFSRQEQGMLASLVRGHRRKFPDEVFEQLPSDDAETARILCAILRLATVLHRSRSSSPLPPMALVGDAGRFGLSFPSGWLDEHPLTRADLEEERDFLAAAGLRLAFT
ncbi:MAG: Ppx/GppA family phosphatase, partial [Gammaproteobacteria bacterium]|nr:Ppx/GppA family phosphatase [Gammaproteobacteria bacterium]